MIISQFKELNNVNVKFENFDKPSVLGSRSFVHILKKFPSVDTADKKHLVSLIVPHNIDFQTRDMSLELHGLLSKILSIKRQSKKNEYEFYR